jgi:hypothetical protein
METMQDTCNTPERDAKRRKLRKGTTSCWDCKKRKVRCIFDATSSTLCIACRRRNAPCIRQDQPEEELEARRSIQRQPTSLSQSGNELGRTSSLTYDQLVERLQKAEQLLARTQSRTYDEEAHPPTPLSYTGQASTSSYRSPTDQPEFLRTPSAFTDRVATDNQAISVALRQAFLSQQDIDILCKTDYMATFYCFQCFTRLDLPEHEASDIVDNLAVIPDAFSTPPVLMARRMLIMALLLQTFCYTATNSLSAPPAVLGGRLVENAVRLVTTNDQLVGCIEGLECIVLEAIFQSNCGNLRRAWIAFRRAIVIAQLMKMDLPNPPPVTYLDSHRTSSPKFMWFRIVHMDSYLSLMLGLPHGGQPTNMENPSLEETPSCRIERAHTLIARRIVDRNRRDPLYQNIEATRELDRQLLDVANSLPDKYWLPLNFTNLKPNTQDAIKEQSRLRDQLHHYNLVHLLHLPFLLACGKQSEYHMYAKTTCINASREILTRFIMYCNFNDITKQACRTADFFALMAGMTILLAHINSYRWQGDNFLAHQRFSDRAMVEQFLQRLEAAAKQTHDSLTSKSAEQLRCLLEFESDAARGVGHTAENTVDHLQERCGEQLQFSIPYFGIIKIGASGISKQSPAQSHLASEAPGLDHDIFSGFGYDLGNSGSLNLLLPVLVENSLQAIDSSSGNGFGQTRQHPPGLTASVNDWAFQGVDAAFFDALMRGTGDWDQALTGS